MPWDQVMHRWKHGNLHSSSKKGPLVKDRNQAIAIMMSEKREAGKGKKEYQPVNTGPSSKVKKRHGVK